MLARRGDARARARRRAAARPGRAEDGALLLPDRDEHARLRVGRRGAGRARPAARRRARGRRERGPRGRRGRLASVLAGGGSGDRGRAALPEDARGARAEAAPPARLRTARPRRHGELRRRACGRSRRSFPGCPAVLALSLNSPYMRGEETGALSARAARLGELPRGAQPPSFASPEDWEAYIEATGTGLHAQLVGRPPASAARHARGADRRPADGASAARRRSPR